MLNRLRAWFGSSRSVKTTDWLPAVKPAWFALKNRELPEAIALAEPLINHRNDIVAAQAQRVLGLAYSRTGQFELACGHLQAAAEQSQDALDWFNLATSAVFAENYDLGDLAIEKAAASQWRSPHIQTLSRPQMRFHYFQALAQSEQHERAFRQLDEIRKIYERFHSTAQDLLQFKKVPFLKRVLDAAVPVLRAVKHEYDVNRWLDDFGRSLDIGGIRVIEQTKRQVFAEHYINAPATDEQGDTERAANATSEDDASPDRA